MLIINNVVMDSVETHEFEGKQMTACQIASFLNQTDGNAQSLHNETPCHDSLRLQSIMKTLARCLQCNTVPLFFVTIKSVHFEKFSLIENTVPVKHSEIKRI